MKLNSRKEDQFIKIIKHLWRSTFLWIIKTICQRYFLCLKISGDETFYFFAKCYCYRHLHFHLVRYGIGNQSKFFDKVARASTDDNHQFFYNTIITYRNDNWKHITMKGTANTLSVVRAAPGATKNVTYRDGMQVISYH